MTLRTIADLRLWVEDTGGAGPPVVFSHGLLWSARLFDPQVAALRARWRCVAYDHPGQGRSAPPPEPGAIGIERCYDAAVALVESLGAGQVHFVGLSMGGFVGMRLAARRPDLVRSLALLETSAEPEPPENAPRYRALALVTRLLGVRPIAGRVLPIMFGRTFRTDPARAAERAVWRGRLLENRRSIWRAVHGVIDRAPVLDELPRIVAPTLVVVGDEDVATVPAKAERIAAAIPGARLAVVPGAGHSSTVEQPARVTALLRDFLDEVERGSSAA